MHASVFQGRVRLLFGLLVLVALVMIIRLYFLQVVYTNVYAERADRQYTSMSVDAFDRGSIFFEDRDGSLVSAAGIKTGYVIALNMRSVATDTERYFSELSSILPISAADFYAIAAKKDDPYEVIAKHVDDAAVAKVSALSLPGVIIEKEKWRYYPGDSLAARIIGFVGFDDSGTSLTGRYGLEKYYNTVLSRDSSALSVNIFAQLFSDIQTNFIDDSKKEGDIVTLIDPQVESYVEQVVKQANAKWSSKLTGAIVIDPKTGALYAMGVMPAFNLNDFSGEKDVSIFGDPLVSNAYEMGSIVKPLTMAAGLDAGVVRADTTYHDTGFETLDGKTIHNYDNKARGTVDMQTVLNQSLNIGAAFVADRLGKSTMLQYFKGYGIGSETGIDLPDEAAGNISNLLTNETNDKKIEYATASFGQGISMTPIITARALSVLANGGKRIIPHVASEIDYKTGLTKKVDYVDEAVQVLQPKTSEEITRMLVKVVDTSLANGTMKMQHYSIAAKTGTAQIARPANQGGGYYPDRYLHSFFGYFPAYNPRFLVFLYTVEPQGVNYASQTLTEPFFDIAKFLINYYEIAPDR